MNTSLYESRTRFRCRPFSATNADESPAMNNEKLFYRPLKPGEIRLLKLRPQKGLNFDMVHADLKKFPKYSALSYTWGNNNLSREILLNGQPFWITENLDQALRQFQQGVTSKETKYPLSSPFWIDAICINQNTSRQALKERSRQVQMMTEIYEQAEKVYVWLGSAKDANQNRAAEIKLRSLGERWIKGQVQKIPFRPWWWPQQHLDVRSIHLRLDHDIAVEEVTEWISSRNATKDAWRGIINMWSSPWWTRAWAYQEGTVAEDDIRVYLKGMTPKSLKSKVKFVCGDAYTTWNCMGAAFRVAGRIAASGVPETNILKGSAASCFRVFNVRRLRVSNEPVSLLPALQRFRLAQCKDPRDKIYAVLGLVAGKRDTILPDYELPTIQIYRGLVAHLLASPDAGLDFLGYTCRLDNEAAAFVDGGKLPSWVPNWHHTLDINPLPKILHVQDPSPIHAVHIGLVDRRLLAGARTIAKVTAYNACGSFTTRDAFIDGRYLRSSGVHIDTVGETMFFSWKAHVRKRTLSRWKAQLSKSTYPNGQHFDKALRQVHCADVRNESLPDLTPVSRGYEIDHSLLFGLEEELKIGSQADMLATLLSTTKLRALCLTKGDRLALVPATSQAGDKVCMLLGGQVLYILRPKGSSSARYEYIGEAYVHGIMDGEISKMVGVGQLSVAQFVLE